MKYPKVFNVIISLTKHYIHLEKCKEDGTRNIVGLENYIKSIIVTEHQIAKGNGNMAKFYTKWDKLFDQAIP